MPLLLLCVACCWRLLQQPRTFVDHLLPAHARRLPALERQRYQTLPADLREEDLHASCWLSPADQQLVAQQRRDSNRLGFAVQLGVLRLLGHLPQEWYRQVPDSLVQFVSRQLTLDPALSGLRRA